MVVVVVRMATNILMAVFPSSIGQSHAYHKRMCFCFAHEHFRYLFLLLF